MKKLLRKLRIALHEVLGFFVFGLLRALERVLPVALFHLIINVVSTLRARLNRLGRRSSYAKDLAAFLKPTRPRQAGVRHLRDKYLNRTLQFFPDRLSEPRWIKRCQFTGLEHLEASCQSGTPVILAMTHAGPYYMVRYWLRAAGFAATSIAAGKRENQTRVLRAKIRRMFRPDIPPVLYLDQIREAIRQLNSGGILIVLVDASARKHVDLPVEAGWSLRLSTGALRLAHEHGATVIPGHIRDEGGWRFQIHFDPPVRQELLRPELKTEAACQQLLDTFLPFIRTHPEQCNPTFLRCVSRTPRSESTSEVG